jgi:hypothetical protein
MPQTTRRGFLLGTLSAGAMLHPASAQATLVRGLSLPVLVARSQRIVVLTPINAVCRYVNIGGRRSLVTDTQVGVHESWSGVAEAELTLRTLGGRLDGVAELVHGQPLLEPDTRALAFLQLGRNASQWWLTGMAQGHFPLTDASETAQLRASRGLPDIVNVESSAVKQLVGRRVSEARELVRRARSS